MPAAWLALAGCSGGDNGDALPAPLTAAEAAAMLTSAPTAYPAVLAVRVTRSSVDVQVRGVQRVGGASLRGDEAFPMGSMTKSMTATLAGVLVQEGRIAWATRIADLLPELAPDLRTEYATVTLADLLAHRGGVFAATTPEQVAQLPAVTGTPTDQRLQLARWALRRAPASTPRVRTEYSNGGYIVAAAMLERAAAQPFETLLQARVFAPLAATVHFGAPGSGSEPWGHARAGGRWVPVDPAAPEAQFPPAANPAGGAKLDGAALARYLQMHLRALRGEGGQLLTPATAAQLHRVVQEGFALGWQAGKDLVGQPLSWHNGSDDASYYGLMAVAGDADVATAVVLSGWEARSEADSSEAAVRLLR